MRTVIGQIIEAVTQPMFSYKKFANFEMLAVGLVKDSHWDGNPIIQIYIAFLSKIGNHTTWAMNHFQKVYKYFMNDCLRANLNRQS